MCMYCLRLKLTGYVKTAVLSCLSTKDIFGMKIVNKCMSDGLQRLGTKFDLICQLNLASLPGHSRGSATVTF